MKRIATFCIVLLLSATFAQAHPLEGGFTPEESASVLHVYDGIREMLNVLGTYCDLKGNAADCLDMNTAAYSAGQGLGWLLHLNTHANGATGKAILDGPRSGVVAEAWPKLDLAISYLNRADSFKVTPAWQAAMAYLQSVDRSQAYATPLPVFADVPLGFDEQNQFGPHGHYLEAQQQLWGTFRYAGFDSMGPVIRAYQSGELAEGFKAVAPLVESARKTFQMLFLSAHLLPDTTNLNYMSPAEELLPSGGNGARRALLEYHLGFGPGESTNATNTTVIAGFRFAVDAVRNATVTYGSNVKRFHQQIVDGWMRFDHWNGYFSGIF